MLHRYKQYPSPAFNMISLVSTVLNDRKGVSIFLKEMEMQSHHPDEIVIVDGGSIDGTWEFLVSYAANGLLPLKYYLEVGCNVARGRNIAIEKSNFNSDIIVSTDIGCQWESKWLEELIAPLELDRTVDYVVGSWAVKPEYIQTAWAKTEFILRGRHIFQATPDAQGTSRSIAYRKAVWQAVGGYPEDLTLAADDNVFILLLQKYGYKAAAAPIVRCYWHRFDYLKQYLKEEKRNFYGLGEAFLARKNFVVVGGRLLTEFLCILGSFLILADSPWLYYGLTTLLIFACSIIHRIFRFLPKATSLADLDVKFPLIRLLIFEYLAKIVGISSYILGLLHGIKHCRNCRVRIYQNPKAHGTELSTTITPTPKSL
ncbi:glycosyl transferase, group 2 family protein [Coleofasciculus chthonoplastes PCC 7420]|uniref:Glycosyl transferase, group 2 family protein n=1 Tax=Coleofasciculus chthonoplastes PCC 7420 TaxID=118168 RepID=B4VH97_9CYAN|nr:glycosyltransferase [Coleofasciculus chthonoplastes]EDX78727.1 glycosyl transferase, group 2 family protein [Coleofasciculus chthonoplastes PCC 7420]